MWSQIAALAILLVVASAQHHEPGQWVRYVGEGPYYPQGRFFHSQSSAGNLAVIFGGTKNGVFFNDLFSYSIEQQSTNLLDSGTGPSGRAGACGLTLGKVVEQYQETDGSITTEVIRNETFVIFGGFDGTNYYNDQWHYDLGGMEWTQATYEGAPTPRAYASCTLDGPPGAEVLSVFGGKDDTTYFGADNFSNYNLSSGKWSFWGNYGQKFPTPRAFIQGVSQGGGLTFYGGYDGSNCLAETWEYKYGAQAWVLIPTTNTPPTNAAYGGVHMLGGGYDIFGGFANCDATTGDLDALSHSSPDWRVVPVSGLSPPARFGTVVTRHGSDLLVFGGADGSIDSDGSLTVTEVFDDLWYYILNQH